MMQIKPVSYSSGQYLFQIPASAGIWTWKKMKLCLAQRLLIFQETFFYTTYIHCRSRFLHPQERRRGRMFLPAACLASLLAHIGKSSASTRINSTFSGLPHYQPSK
jgi:hypothetical protein